MNFSLLSLIFVIGIFCYVSTLDLNHINGKKQPMHKNRLAVNPGMTGHALKRKSPTIHHPSSMKAKIGNNKRRPLPTAVKLKPKSKSFVKPTERHVPANARLPANAIVPANARVKATARVKPTPNGSNSLKQLEEALKKTEQSLAQEIKSLKQSKQGSKDYPSYDQLNYQIKDYNPANYQ